MIIRGRETAYKTRTSMVIENLPHDTKLVLRDLEEKYKPSKKKYIIPRKITKIRLPFSADVPITNETLVIAKMAGYIIKVLDEEECCERCRTVLRGSESREKLFTLISINFICKG